jgi:hypothetical protein
VCFSATADTRSVPVNRIIGESSVVDELIIEFTHDQEVRENLNYTPQGLSGVGRQALACLNAGRVLVGMRHIKSSGRQAVQPCSRCRLCDCVLWLLPISCNEVQGAWLGFLPAMLGCLPAFLCRISSCPQGFPLLLQFLNASSGSPSALSGWPSALLGTFSLPCHADRVHAAGSATHPQEGLHPAHCGCAI